MKQTISIKNIWILVATAFAFSGCSKSLLKEKNPSQVTTDFLYSTADGLSAAVTGLYTIERSINADNRGNGSAFALIMGDGGTDIDFDMSSYPELAYYRTDLDLTTSAPVSWWWSMWYKLIERTNSIITYGQKDAIDYTTKKSILREAYVYRAYAYFWLLRKYDNIWLDTIPTTSENVDGRNFTVAKQSDVYALINSDLDSAISYYGEDWTVVPGRFNQGVARLLKADVALWQQNYQVAATQADAIINSGTFSLIDPTQVFTQDGRDNTKESMYVMQYDQYAIGGGDFHRQPLIFTAAYRLVPGCTGAVEDGGYGWGRMFPNSYLISLFDSAYDKRLDAYWQRYYTYNDPNYDFSRVDYKFGDTLRYGDNSQLTKTNYYNNANISCKKYRDYTQGPTVTKHYNNIYIYRYPQVLLIAAEAYMHLGDDDKALGYINQIRQSRISPDDPNQLFTSINQQEILDEYARELGFEGQRWFLLKRLGLLVERVQVYGGEKNFRGVPAPNPLYYSARTNIQPYHVRWPIPQSSLDAMGGFPQNPGYK